MKRVKNTMKQGQRLCAAVIFSVALLGCGGPLSHTVKLSQVPESHRSELNDAKLATGDAEVKRDEARHDVTVKEQELKEARSALEASEHDIEIAKAHLEMQKAKAAADRGGDKDTAKTKLNLAKVKRDVAEAQVELDERELDLAEAQAEEAHASWLVALAVYESEKAKLIESDDPKLVEKQQKIEKQLADKKEDQTKAHAKVEKLNEKVEKAKARLADAADN